ncbi:MAG: flagellar basal body-associated FliL family protein [Sulfitobacter sp.]
MAEPETEETPEPPKKSKKPLIIGLILALVGGGGGFYAASSGLILPGESNDHAAKAAKHVPVSKDIAFIPVDPMIVSLHGGTTAQHLRFRAQLEVPSAYQEDVTKLLPRVVDVLNGYLAALELSDIQDPSALMRLRAQMLRRVQIVTGGAQVSDLLIMEFVLN